MPLTGHDVVDAGPAASAQRYRPDFDCGYTGAGADVDFQVRRRGTRSQVLQPETITMLGRLILIFILLGLLELAILLRLGEAIGFWPTFGLVLASGAAGVFLAQHQGARALRSIQTELRAGRPPAASLVDGFLVLVGAVLLIAPGLLTDLCGLILLLPASRRRFRESMRRRFERMARSGEVRMITLIR